MRSRVLVLIWFVFSVVISAQVLRKSSRGIVIENDVIERNITVFTDQPGPIKNLFRDKKTKKIILTNEVKPWFKLWVDGKVVTSNQPLWKIKKFYELKLQNGGKEFLFQFDCGAEDLSGLTVQVLIQNYKSDDFFREKILFFSSTSNVHHLTKNNNTTFEFGSYSYPADKDDILISEEIRLATWNGQLIETDYSSSFDNKILEKDWRTGRNLEQNYMYHPRRIKSSIKINSDNSLLGPFAVFYNKSKNYGFWLAYEHGAPDNEPDQKFVNIISSRDSKYLTESIVIPKSAYYDGEEISAEKVFESLWYSYDFFNGNSEADANKSIWNYLKNYICINHASRTPLFYYNTWGMQRDESLRGKDVRGVLTEEKIKQEINDASELGIDLFVLDDGWQDFFGDWGINKERLPNGLSFYVEELKKKSIMPGIWIAPTATDPNAAVTKLHPEWLIRDEKDEPIIGQWKMNFFCFNSAFKEYFIDRCKKLIDLGIRYFKWDGINTYLCQSDLHNHGTSIQSIIERRELGGYKLPLEITDAIRQLKEYQSDLIIEIDVTEANRNVGLAFLSEARYFWMNNGAAWYGDYSTHRAKSTRMITNLYGEFLPTSLQTFACFPMNDPVYKAQNYNVNSAMIGGRGFWGNIALMKPEERFRIGERVKKHKLVESVSSKVYPKISGTVGSSPEIYEYVDKTLSTGKIIAFSGSALKSNYKISGIDTEKFLCVLNQSYVCTSDKIDLNFEFYSPDDSKDAIILPNEGSGISIESSTAWLRDVKLQNQSNLEFINGASGTHIIKWPKRLGKPSVQSDKEIKVEFLPETKNDFRISVKTVYENEKIIISTSALNAK